MRIVKILRNTNFTKNGFLNLSDVAEHPVEERQLESRLLQFGDILLEKSGGGPTQPVGRVAFFNLHEGQYSYSNFTARIRVVNEKANPTFVWLMLNAIYQRGGTEGLQKQTSGIRNLDNPAYQALQIPLPPLEVQHQIVVEIEGYQKIIDGARQVLDNYKPHIVVGPDWPVVQVGDVCSLSSGGTPSKANPAYWQGAIPWVSAKDMKADLLVGALLHVSDAAVRETSTRLVQPGSLLILVRGMGLANGVPICEIAMPCTFNQDVKAMEPTAAVDATFLRLSLQQQTAQFEKILETAAHGTLKINTPDLLKIQLPLPSMETQRAIVAEIEVEEALVASNRELIRRMQARVKAAIDRVWGAA